MPLPPPPPHRRRLLVRAPLALTATLALAASLTACTASLSAEADAWCKANPDAVLRASSQLRDSGTTNGWDPTKDQFVRACQRAWDTKDAAGTPAPVVAPLPS
ncbi:MAG: hypothetical protein U0869_18865 [Chloroflexota bacterium]